MDVFYSVFYSDLLISIQEIISLHLMSKLGLVDS